MQIKPDILPSYLITHALMPLYVLMSDEPLFVLEASVLIGQHARAHGYTGQTILTVEQGFQWQDWHMAQQSLSFLENKKLIELRIPTGKPGKEGGRILQHYVNTLEKASTEQGDFFSHITLIQLPKLDAALQKATWFSALTHSKYSLYIDIASLPRAHLPQWISKRLNTQQHKVDTAALKWMADRFEGNLLAAHQEIQKLALLYPCGELSLEQIQSAITDVARHDIFQLGEALLTRDLPRFLHILATLKQAGTALPLVLWAITQDCRILLKLTLGLQQGQHLGAMFKEYRIWGHRQHWMRQAVSTLSPAWLSTLLQEAAQIDQVIKGVYATYLSGDGWQALSKLAWKVSL